MPNKDGTGPLGRGPLTGRGLGDCCPREQSGIGRGFRQGRGFNRGRGFGRGFDRNFGPGCNQIDTQRAFQLSAPVELTKKEKAEILKAELKQITEEKTAIEKELKNLK